MFQSLLLILLTGGKLTDLYLSIYQTRKMVNVIGKIGQICKILKGNECSYIEICVNISYKILDLLFY